MVLLVGCLLAVSVGCARRVSNGPRQQIPVPMTPPDSIPPWITADSTLDRDAGFTKGVVVVFFHTGATQRQRQAAVDLIGGRVVGDDPIGPGEGYYYLRVAVDGGAGMQRVVAKLEALPQVQSAGLPCHIALGPSQRRPPTSR